MKRLVFLLLTLVMLATMVRPSTVFAQGVTQISGISYWPNDGECTDPEGAGADYAVKMTGDLEGCHYTFVQTAVCTPGGAYVETGIETFVGQFHGESGTFMTTYRFTAKYDNCTNFVEQVGRCQHPIIESSGTGIFEGATGRIDIKDDIAAGNFPYRGHLDLLTSLSP